MEYKRKETKEKKQMISRGDKTRYNEIKKKNVNERDI